MTFRKLWHQSPAMMCGSGIPTQPVQLSKGEEYRHRTNELCDLNHVQSDAPETAIAIMSDTRRHALAMFSPMVAPHDGLGVLQCSREDHESRGDKSDNL